MDENRKSQFSSIKDIIASIMKRPGFSFNPDDSNIWKIWEEAVGAGIAANATPAWIRDGVLRVDVNEPIWLQELQYAEEEIKEKVNAAMKRDAVKRIDFRLARK